MVNMPRRQSHEGRPATESAPFLEWVKCELSLGSGHDEDDFRRDLIIAPKTISGIIVTIIAIHIQSGMVPDISGSVIP